MKENSFAVKLLLVLNETKIELVYDWYEWKMT